MLSLEEKRDLIIERERSFCQSVSASIMEKPKLAVWMILIPVFFVFYFWQLQRYSQGIRNFTTEYLTTRKRALDYVYTALSDGDTIDPGAHLQATDIPSGAEEAYLLWVEVLAAYYGDLMRAQGDSYEDLVRSAYSSKKRFRDALDSLNRAEREFHLQLQPDLDVAAADEIIRKIEMVSVRLRRDQLSEVFS